MCLDPGTLQSDHIEVSCTKLRRVPRTPAHGKDWNFAMCLDPSTRRSLNLCRVPQILTHGEVGSRRRHPRAVTIPAPAPPSVPLICRVPPVAKMASHAIFQYNVLAIDDTHNTWTNICVNMIFIRLIGPRDEKIEDLEEIRSKGPRQR